MKSGSLIVAVLACLTTTASAISPAPQTPIDALFASGVGETRGVLLILDGKIIQKRYGAGYSDANRFISWSMAKTVTAVLIGELVADGKLALDAPVPVAEWQSADDPRRAITLRQLLNMSSGLAHTEVGDPVEASDTNQVLFVSGTENMAARAIGASLEAKPGAKFEYSSLTTLLLSEIITRTLTPSKDPKVRAAAYRAFAQERLFKPAGITSAVLDFDRAGTQIGGSIIYMTLDDFGRLGQVLLAGKGQKGTNIIDPDWLTFMRAPSPTNAEYGGQTWLNRPSKVANAPTLFPGKGAETLYACTGHLGQFVIVSPDQDMVIVRLGKTDDASADFPRLRSALGNIAAAIPLKISGAARDYGSKPISETGVQ